MEEGSTAWGNYRKRRKKEDSLFKGDWIDGAENSRGLLYYKGIVGNEARKENWKQIAEGLKCLVRNVDFVFLVLGSSWRVWRKEWHDEKVFGTINPTAVCRAHWREMGQKAAATGNWSWGAFWFCWV
jgi:hypothetical protein